MAGLSKHQRGRARYRGPVNEKEDVGLARYSDIIKVDDDDDDDDEFQGPLRQGQFRSAKATTHRSPTFDAEANRRSRATRTRRNDANYQMFAERAMATFMINKTDRTASSPRTLAPFGPRNETVSEWLTMSDKSRAFRQAVQNVPLWRDTIHQERGFIFAAATFCLLFPGEADIPDFNTSQNATLIQDGKFRGGIHNLAVNFGYSAATRLGFAPATWSVMKRRAPLHILPPEVQVIAWVRLFPFRRRRTVVTQLYKLHFHGSLVRQWNTYVRNG